MKLFPFPLLGPLRLLLLLPLAALALPALVSGDDLPPNLGRGLRPLVEWHRQQSAPRTAAESRDALAAHLGRNARRIQYDDAGAVTVDLRLDGTVPADEVKKSLAALGLTLTGEHAARRADGRDGILSARLPLAQAEAAAKVPGVFSVLTAHRPRPRAGRVTSQGVGILQADAVQSRGYTGKGITIGVISDSYNVATARSAGAPVTTTAAQDIASGDLPAGITVLQDGSSAASAGNTDEGRAMMQIIHDVAPSAALAFCAVGNTLTDFAANIRSLRAAGCDIIVDDIGFDDEPFFSDSIVAQAVDDVVTSSTLAGRQAIYYSAAGNDGDTSYAATFTPVSDAAARAGQAGVNNLQLSQVPVGLTAQGFHNFRGAATGTGTKIVQKVIVSGADAVFNFQWDDPFLPGGITADYNLLVFDANGNYRSDLSGIDNNYSTGEAIEYLDLPTNSDGSDATYQLVITRASSRGTPAARLRYLIEGGAVVAGKYLQTGVPTLFGHSGAANADGVAAYDVHDLSAAEPFESFGPVTIYFDSQGNRLATPATRQQPTIAAVDGVNTTFFPEGAGNDSDSPPDGFPNFYGTSAAAPHAAAVAALLLEAAGGHGKLGSTQMRALLEGTATAHDLDPAASVADFTSADGQFHVTVKAQGDGGDNSAFSQRFFTVTYTGPAGSSLTKLALDLGPASEEFDQSASTGGLATSTNGGFPFTIGLTQGVVKTAITAVEGVDASGKINAKLSVLVTPGAFQAGGVVSFGIDRDNNSTHNGGNSADVLAGATAKAVFTLADGTKVKAAGTFANRTGKGYSPDVGFGLINTEAALVQLLGR